MARLDEPTWKKIGCGTSIAALVGFVGGVFGLRVAQLFMAGRRNR